MDSFDRPSMKLHGFIRMFVLPVDLAVTVFLFYSYFFKDVSFFSSPYSLTAVRVLLCVKAVQVVVNAATQIGFLTYSGYSFYGIFAFFGLRVLFYAFAFAGRIQPVLGSLPDFVILLLSHNLFKKYAIYNAVSAVSMIGSLVLMAGVSVYYIMRRQVFHLRASRKKTSKPVRERNEPWRPREKFKPERKPRVSRHAQRDIKSRRLDVISGAEKTEPEPPKPGSEPDPESP